MCITANKQKRQNDYFEGAFGYLQSVVRNVKTTK